MINASQAGLRAVKNSRPSRLDEARLPASTKTRPAIPPAKIAVSDADLDHFVERDGMRFAGTHLIVDLWQASQLDDIGAVEEALRDAAEAAGATLLNMDLHRFTPNGGITGVAVLAESHISIHTWPERAYAAVDVFMCGEAEPHRAIEVLKGAFTPGMMTVAEHRRGVVP
ncbi:adenosylmethionine decarboxylase [Enterovirga rhinocerotis]|uniref:S-adenosylmethionine decarboxylase proenzyme n=1 Tax=Enterovirga rhinocerotis TaxID=1339210 RepID=A0A4R7C0F2_9HYPH|nr:adenosylmethionine decarboxylase [Enterovirga rhinocerotis]TDR89957.1 S-adenosylmethionine decarboxylase [Enterovirga rhinocerotis]